MNSGNTPDIDPANNDSLAGTIQFAFNKLLQNVNGMLPAKVIKYNRTTNRVQVQLLIAVMTTSGAQISRPQIASLPVIVTGGGGFFLSFNLNPDDLGWVMANDRDISLFLQSYSESAPNTGRIKNFADGLFIPDIMKGYTIQPEDNNAAVLSNTDGSIRIAISSSGVKITAPTVTIEGAQVIDGDLTVNGTSHITGIITGDAGANLTGNIVLTGLGTFAFVMTP